MATTQYPVFGSLVTVSTLTGLPGLANGAYWALAAIDNTVAPPSGQFLDAELQIKVRTGTGVVAGGYLQVFGYGSNDGTNFSDGIAGTTGVVTPTASPGPNFGLIGTIATPGTTVASFTSKLLYASNAFAGWLPDHWGIVLCNQSGAALDATAGNFSVTWKGLNFIFQ